MTTAVRRLTLALALLALCVPLPATAQAVKGKLDPATPPPPLMYHGLIPGLHKTAEVKAAVGDPEFAARWYSYKMYYPAKDRPGFYDVIHMDGNSPDSRLANIDAASVPDGYENASAIAAKFGEPQYELRMATWRLLDYSEKGVRFAVTPDGKTIGVAYFPHTYRRVPAGERSLVDLSQLRQGVQPAPAKPADLQGLRVGVAERIVSPKEKDWLNHPFEVTTDLKARIAVFQANGLTVGFVGADLFGMGYAQLKVIRDAAKEMGIDHVICGLSHNHAAGDTTGFYGFYPEKYIAHIQAQAIDGLKEALAKLQPVAELKVASKELPMDGIRVQHLFRNARNPGVLDPTIDLIQAIGKDGKTIVTMVHFACHVESIQEGGKEITADFPGYMCDQIQKDFGGQPLFLNGAVGGMVSGDNRARTDESSKEMGLQLAAIVKDLAKTAQPPATFEFAAECRSLEIPVTNKDFLPAFEKLGRPNNRGRALTDMTYIKLGEAQFISLPGELLPEVSFEILEHMDGFPRCLVGLGNDQMGYLIPPYDFRNDEYEESVSPGPSAAVQVRDMALRLTGKRP